MKKLIGTKGEEVIPDETHNLIDLENLKLEYLSGDDEGYEFARENIDIRDFSRCFAHKMEEGQFSTADELIHEMMLESQLHTLANFIDMDKFMEEGANNNDEIVIVKTKDGRDFYEEI